MKLTLAEQWPTRCICEILEQLIFANDNYICHKINLLLLCLYSSKRSPSECSSFRDNRPCITVGNYIVGPSASRPTEWRYNEIYSIDKKH